MARWSTQAYFLQDVVRVVDRLGEMGVSLTDQRRVLEKALANADLAERFVQDVRLKVVEHQTRKVHYLLKVAKYGLFLRRFDLQVD